MKDELFFNGQCAYTNYGVEMGPTSLSALMTPAPTKEFIKSECRTEDGVRTMMGNGDPKVNSRDITLEISIHARDIATYMQRYNSFVEMLTAGAVEISTKYQPGVKYKCYYVSTTTFSQYNGRAAKLIIKLTEPNPKDRA